MSALSLAFQRAMDRRVGPNSEGEAIEGTHINDLLNPICTIEGCVYISLVSIEISSGS